MQLLNRSMLKESSPGTSGLTMVIFVIVTSGAGCYHAVAIPPGTPEIAARQAADDSVSKAQRNVPPRCRSYVLLVENALPRAVEIYEVGHNVADRLVAMAQIGFTEVPMTESTQQFVAMSRGEVMAAATNSDQRAGDRVALQRSCRPY